MPQGPALNGIFVVSELRTKNVRLGFQVGPHLPLYTRRGGIETYYYGIEVSVTPLQSLSIIKYL